MQSLYLKLDETCLAVLDLCPYYDKGYIITRINVPVKYRGKGIGSTLLKKCCKQADENNVTLFLEVYATGGLQAKQLHAWYKRHGFRDSWGMMKRLSRHRSS